MAAPPTEKKSLAISNLLTWELGARLREWEAPQHSSQSLRLLTFLLVSLLKTNIPEKFIDLGHSKKVPVGNEMKRTLPSFSIKYRQASEPSTRPMAGQGGGRSRCSHHHCLGPSTGLH